MSTKSSKSGDQAAATCAAPSAGSALYPPRLDELALDEALGAGPDYAAILESICGATDDSQPVEQYDGSLGVTTGFVAAHQRPAVQVQWNDDLATHFANPGNVSGVRWGSATLISPDLVLTCGHLFDQDPNGWTVPRQNGTASALAPADIARQMHINVDYQVDASGVLRSEVRFPIVDLVEYRLGGLDMAICRVGGAPGASYGFTEVSQVDAAVGDMLAIIGHPAGQPKRIEAGPASIVAGGRVQYGDIDTLGGNSGSGILHASTGRLVGVHTNGGCTSTGGTNSGVAIAAIRAVSPTLQALQVDTGWRDTLGTIAAADLGQTVRALDTLRAADVHGTGWGMDTLVSRDTHLARDTLLSRDLSTGWRDTAGTVVAGDTPHTLVETIHDPGQVFDPLLDPLVGRPGLRPFVQAGAYQQVSPLQQLGAGSPGSLGATGAEDPRDVAREELAAQLTIALEALHGALDALENS